MAKKKKRKLKKSVKLLLFLCIIVIGLIYLNNTTKDTDNITSNNDIKENKEIKEDKSNEETKEVDYNSLDTLGKLEYLSTKDKRINKITLILFIAFLIHSNSFFTYASFTAFHIGEKTIVDTKKIQLKYLYTILNGVTSSGDKTCDIIILEAV